MDDERLERIERRMEELDQRSSATERAVERAMDRSKAAMATIMPAETRRHLRAAGRENLLAVRSLLDFWVERLGDSGGDDKPAGPGRENIPID